MKEIKRDYQSALESIAIILMVCFKTVFIFFYDPLERALKKKDILCIILGAISCVLLVYNVLCKFLPLPWGIIWYSDLAATKIFFPIFEGSPTWIEEFFLLLETFIVIGILSLISRLKQKMPLKVGLHIGSLD